VAVHHFQIYSLVRMLENDACLVEALLYPEFSSFGDHPERLLEAVSNRAREILKRSGVLEIHRRQMPSEPEIRELSMTLDPDPQTKSWTRPLELKFHTVTWRHGSHAFVAYVPELGIGLPIDSVEEIEERVREEIGYALARAGWTKSLRDLALLQRCRELRIAGRDFETEIKTPKRLAAESERDEPEKSALSEAARELLPAELPEAYEIETLVRRIADSLSRRPARSVLLVGPSGVGKTSAVYELARCRAELGLSGRRFWATSGARLVAGMCGFGMWQERCRRLVKETAESGAILHLGNLVELMEVGKSVSNSQGIGAFLRTHLQRGEVLAVAECTPEQLSLIEQEDPHMVDVFHRLDIREPDVETGKAILLSSALAPPRLPASVLRGKRRAGKAAKVKPKKGGIDVEGIETLDRLHRRFGTYSAYPGRPVRFLENLLRDCPENVTLSSGEVVEAFSKETGLPLFMLDESVPLDLDETQAWFEERVIGQPAAATLIVDMLAAVKAQLTRPGKPIASLLFIGPTGVGKTEMAKTLAQFLFGSRDRLTRFDMSEYGDPVSAKRLTGGVFGEEGALTARVRETPFSVVLLDEFEKADASVFDLLLQVLGEGRLTDAGGRVADFRNAVVIMTSNLGAESFQRDSLGFVEDAAGQRQACEHFLDAVREFVRPELFNRIDAVVPFSPLDETTVLRIAEREIRLIGRRDGVLHRGLDLSVPDEVVRYLAVKGFDPKYGARPLKRAIERELLVPIADAVNGYSSEIALSVEATVESGAVRVRVRAGPDPYKRPIRESAARYRSSGCAYKFTRLRRAVQGLERSPALINLRNELFRLRQQRRHAERRARRAKDASFAPSPSAHLKKLEALDRDVTLLAESVRASETEACLRALDKSDATLEHLEDALRKAEEEWTRVLLAVYETGYEQPHRVTVAILGEDARVLSTLTEAYFLMLTGKGYRVTAVHYSAESRSRGRRAFKAQRLADPRRPQEVPAKGVLGVGLEISGKHAYPRLKDEAGLHVFQDGQEVRRCAVETSELLLRKYTPPAEFLRPGHIGSQPLRRTYAGQRSLEDAVLERTFSQTGRVLHQLLDQAIETHFWNVVKEELAGP